MMKIEKLHRILLIRFLFVLTIIFFQFADGQTIENVLTSTNLHFALDNFQEKEIVRLSVAQGITTVVEVEITLPLGIEYAEGTAVITKGEAKIIQKAGTLLSQPTFVVTINKGNTITFEFNRKVTSQALLLKGELKDIIKLKVGERLYDTKLSNSYYLHSPSLLLQPSPIVFDKKEGEHNDFFVLSNTGIGGVKDIYFSVDYPEEVSLIDLKYKGKKILPIGVVPAGYVNAGTPLYRVEGTFFNEKKDRIIIYEHYTVANCQANCPIKYVTYWGDNTLHFYETKEETKLLHLEEEPTVITLSDDTYTLTITESTTTTATTVGSVFSNDSMNGKTIDIQKVIFSLLPQSTSTSFVITKDGNIIVPAHTPIGRYTLNYRIYDNSQPSKDKSQKTICQTATVTIAILQSVTTPTTATSTTVTATTTPTVITLSDDTYTVTTTDSTTTTATTVGSVFTNDRLNGNPIDIQKVIFSLLPQSTPTSFVITKDGNIIVPAYPRIGRYTLNYRICDNSQPSKNKNFKPVCQTATVTIVVQQSVTTPTTSTTITATTTTPTVITLSDDTYTLTTTESATTTITTVGSVFSNDRMNGKPIDIQKVIFSLLPRSTPTSFIITKEGNIIVPSHTPIGCYTLNYRICDNSQTSKDKNHKPICQTATVTIVILQSVITPTTTTSTTVTATTTVATPTVITLSDDTYTITTTESSTTTATTVGSVFTNDNMNGKPIDIQKVIFSLLPQSTPNTFIITKGGNIIVPAQTPIGRYTLNYRICDNSQTLKDKNHKPVCQTATITIVVLQSVTTLTTNTPTTTTSTTLTTTTTPTVVTPTVITLSDDTYTFTTTESTTTTATTVGSVFSNDCMNGKPIDIQKVIFSLLPQSTPNTFIITKDGNIIIPAQTPIGCYTLNYRICDNSQPLKNKSQKSVCQTATVTIAVLQLVTTPTTTTSTTTTPTVVTPTVITLSDDTYTITTTESTTTTATTVGSVFTNDHMNGKPIDIQKVIFSLLPQSTPTSFVITKDGNIIVPSQTPIGRYTLNYRICDNSQPLKDKSQKPVCQTATVTIAVLQSVTTPTTTTPTTVTSTTTPTVITLSDDTYTITTTESTTTTATTVGSVFSNDRMNGKPIDIRKVIFSLLPQSTPTSFVITKDGNIIVPPHTPIGRYILNYHICDSSQTLKNKSQKPVCQTATVTVAILQSVTTPTTTTPTTVTSTTTPTVITLSDDTYTVTTTESTTTTATTVGSVFTNDRLNGKSINIQKVIFSLLPQSMPNTFIITKDGNIIVPAQTPIGCYTLNYRICDNSQTLKDKSLKPVCQTATVTIVILQSVTTPTTTTSSTVTVTTTPTVVTPTVITLSDDTYIITTTESTTTTAITVGSVFTNDHINGKPIDIQKVIFSLLPQSTPNTFVITKEGNIIVSAQTPIGRYTLNYRICDNSQTSKNKNQKPICQTATVTIAILQSVTTPTTTTSTTVTTTTTPTIVTPTTITLLDDTYTITTTESTTTTATTVGSVFTNDRLNGKPIDIQKVIFSLLPQSTPTSFIITKDGNIIVPPQTPVGRYTLNYRICDNSQPSKDKSLKPICQTATVTIAILQSVTTPTTTTNTTITATTTPTIVTSTVITLSDDTYTITTTESTTTIATTVGSVFTNDRLNGKPIDIQKVIFSLLPQSTPNTFIITKDGNIIVPPHTPIGRYTLNYRICDNSQPSKDKNYKPICKTATVTIAVLQSATTPTTAISTTVVTPTVIALSDDTYTVTTTESITTTATTVGSVFTNDRINGKPIDIQKVIFSLLPQSTPNTFVITKDSNIIVPAQTPIGRYTLNYRICDNSQPSKDKTYKPVCQTATVTIVVLQSVTTPTTTLSTTTTATVITPTIITLSDDTYTLTTTESVTTTATTVGSVFSNDRLNGKPIDIQKVIFSLLPQSTPNTFIITKDGNIIIPPHTPIGRYTLNYRICDNSQPSKNKNFKPICQTATVTIAVLQSVTTPTTATNTTVTATTIATVVTPTVIALSDDTYTVTTTESTTTIATTVGSVFTNDRLNGKPIDIQKVIFSLLPQSTPISFVITKDGNIIVPAKTPIGRYTLNYRICDNSQTSKDNSLKPICQTTTVTIAILQSVTTPTTTTSTTVTATTTPTVITLSDDTYTLTTTESVTTTATTVGSVFTNDRLNGKPIDIQKVIFSLLPQSTPISFVITKDGNIIVPPQTPIGHYTLNYRICDNSQTLKDKNQKPICQTATVTIAVLQSVTTPTTTTSTTVTATITPTVITLSDDTYTITTTRSTTTTATTVGSVFSNDCMNGKPIDIQKVIFSLLPQSTPNTFIITKDGNIIVPPQTPIGRYSLNYRICDNSQPLKDKSLKHICQTATVTIIVLQSVTTSTVITLSDDTYTLTTTESATTTATTVGSVFSNDRMNGKPIDIQKVIFSLLPQSTPNTFIITKNGNIIVPAQTPIGRYTLNYHICDNSQTSKGKSLKSVCQTATVTIVVLQSVTTTTTNTTITTTTTPAVITLSDDTYTVTTTESTTTTATTVGSVFSNDSLNGKPIDIQKVIFSLLPQSTPNTFIITKEGNIIVPAQTRIGRYTLNYRICDNSQPSSQKPVCQTATITIVVLQSVTTPTTTTPTIATSTTITATTTPTIVTPTIITLSDDTYTVTTTESTTTTATTVGSVFSNDSMNGKPIDIQKVIFSLLPQSTPTSFVITKDGNIIVPSQTPIGHYTLNYRICDSKNKNQKPICQTATITITILQTPVTPTVSATIETATSSTTQSVTNQPIAVSDSATTPMNTPIRIAVLDNDTPYTASPKIVVFPTNGDAFVKEDNTILYRPRVRFIGTDYFVYELCTPSSQSCTTATVTVKVTHKVVADNAMSANGDDKNDYFHIVGIENYPDNQVTIYNRNGEKVFTISHYDNRQRVFKGIVEGEVSLPNAALLPQDTYFYLIEYYDENRQLQRQIGWLYLKR